MNLTVNNKQDKGFTLIELLVVIAIIGILSSIAYPNYQNSVRKTHREEGKRTLIKAAQHMENFYAMNLTYTGAISSGAITGFSPSAEFNVDYTLTVPNSSANAFTLTATPKSGSIQADDTCGVLSIDNFSTTSATLSGTSVTGCW